MDHLLNKPFVTGVSLGEYTVYLKYYQTLKQKICQRGQDLLKEVLWVSEDQTAAKLQAVKVGGWKKILLPDWSQTTCVMHDAWV